MLTPFCSIRAAENFHSLLQSQPKPGHETAGMARVLHWDA